MATGEECGRLAQIKQLRCLAGVLVWNRLRDALVSGARNMESGVVHAQRPQDFLIEECVERLARHDFDHAPEYVGGMAVLPGCARFVDQRQLRQRTAPFGEHPFLGKNVGFGVRLFDQRWCAEQTVGKARSMAQQILHRDLAFGINQTERKFTGSIGCFDADFHVLELGDELGDGFVQAKPAFFHKHHGGDAHDGLGHRIDAKDRIVVHGDLAFAILPAEIARVHEFAIARDHDYRTGQLADVHCVLQGCVKSCEARRGHAHGFRSSFRQRSRVNGKGCRGKQSQ